MPPLPWFEDDEGGLFCGAPVRDLEMQVKLPDTRLVPTGS
jgi:hypothetical protein